MAVVIPAETQDVLQTLLARYHPNCYAFVREMFRSKPTPTPHQIQLLKAITRGDRRVSVRSGRGTGKSTTVSWLAIWFLLHRANVKVLITAPSAPQLFDALFAEIKRWIADLEPIYSNLLDVKADRVELKAAPGENFITLRTARRDAPEAMQGVHADHVLIIVDEASGVDDNVFQALSGSMAGPSRQMVLLGNPTRTSGFFFDTHHLLSDTWTTLHWSCVDSARPGMKEYVSEQALKLGVDSNEFRIHVTGDFPLADDDTVIPAYLVNAAATRELSEPFPVAEVWGLDVAGDGKSSDASVLFKRRGSNAAVGLRKWRNLDPMQLVGAVKAEYESSYPRPVAIAVDGIGMGGPIAARLRELGLPAVSINVSESPAVKLHGSGGYVNLRAQLCYEGRSFLEKRDSRLLDDNELKEELISIRCRPPSPSGKIGIELKRDFKQRVGRSPDKMDAFLLTFAVDASKAQGSLLARTTPLTRNRPVLK